MHLLVKFKRFTKFETEDLIKIALKMSVNVHQKQLNNEHRKENSKILRESTLIHRKTRNRNNLFSFMKLGLLAFSTFIICKILAISIAQEISGTKIDNL